MAAIVKKSGLNNFFQKIIPYRLWVQAAFLIVWLDPLALRMHNICSPVFHCYACPLATFACPIGVIAQFGAIHLFPFLAVGILILFGAVFGAIICGWMCPFGLLQDLAAKTPLRKFPLPAWTGVFRYVVLVVTVLAVPYFFGEGHWLFICRICPAGAVEKAVPDMLSQALGGSQIIRPNAIKLTILSVFIVAIFVTIRPWCRLFCPLGAIFGLFNRFSFLSMKFEDRKCTRRCNRCHTLCSYGVLPDKTPDSLRCVRCFECTECPPGALEVSSALSAAKETPC